MTRQDTSSHALRYPRHKRLSQSRGPIHPKQDNCSQRWYLKTTFIQRCHLATCEGTGSNSGRWVPSNIFDGYWDAMDQVKYPHCHQAWDSWDRYVKLLSCYIIVIQNWSLARDVRRQQAYPEWKGEIWTSITTVSCKGNKILTSKPVEFRDT